jgi:DNA-directed RNA polymerase specialized sigma24 family protein
VQALVQEGARVANPLPGQESTPFDDWVAVRGPALLKLAYTLTGNAADAEDVVQEALARVLPRWERISRVDNVDAYVRRMVVNAHTSWWRRFRPERLRLVLPGGGPAAGRGHVGVPVRRVRPARAERVAGCRRRRHRGAGDPRGATRHAAWSGSVPDGVSLPSELRQR